MPTSCRTSRSIDFLILPCLWGQGNLVSVCADPLSYMGHIDTPMAFRRTVGVEYNHKVEISPPPRMPSPRHLTFKHPPSTNGGVGSWGLPASDGPSLSPITSVLIPLSIFHVSSPLQTTNLSRAGPCVFHLLSQRGAQSMEPSSHRGVCIDRGC